MSGPRMPKPTPSVEQKKTARALVGKTIARVVLMPNGKSSSGAETTNEVVITFTDDSTLRFVVVDEEEDGGEYGVDLIYPARSDAMERSCDGFVTRDRENGYRPTTRARKDGTP